MCTLYVTLEPCNMCIEAAKQARIMCIKYAAKQEKKPHLKEPKIKQIKNVEKASELLRNVITFFRTYFLLLWINMI